MKITAWTKFTLALPCFAAAVAIGMLIIESWNYQSWAGLIFTIGANMALFGSLGICVCLGCLMIIWDD